MQQILLATVPFFALLLCGYLVTRARLLMVALTLLSTRRGAIGWNDASFGAFVAAFPNSGFMDVPLLVALIGDRAA